MEGASKDITVFRIIVPSVPYKLRCRNLFGVQQFAEEAQAALEEKLITYEDFTYVRDMFHRALKIRAEFDAGHFNQDEFYSHAVTLFSDLIDQDDGTVTVNSGSDISSGDRMSLKLGQTAFDQTTYVLQGYYEYCCKQLMLKEEDTTQGLVEYGSRQNISTDNSQSVNCVQESDMSQSELRKPQHYEIQQQQQYSSDDKRFYNVLEEKHSSNLEKMSVDKDGINFSKLRNSGRYPSSQQFEKEDEYEEERVGENTHHYAYALQSQQSMDSYKERGNVSPYRRSYLDQEDSRRPDSCLSPLPRVFKWGVDTDYVRLTNRHLSSSASTPRAFFSQESYLKNSKRTNDLVIQKLKQECGDRIEDDEYINHFHQFKNYSHKYSRQEEDSDCVSNPSDLLSPAPSFVTCREDSYLATKHDIESRLQKEEYSRRGGALSPTPLFFREQLKSPTFSEQSFSTQFSVSSLPKKGPRVWRNSRRLDGAKRSLSINECVLAEEAYSMFEDMCTCGTYKWLIFQLNPHNQHIEVCDAGDGTTTYKQLLATLQPDKCSYAVYNQGLNKFQRTAPRKIIFINWRPEGSPGKQRMTYAQNKDFLKSCLGSISLEVQATEVGDLDENYILQQVQ